MNVNLYLPDDLGQQAKEAELPLSQMLRTAVVDELERRKVVSETLAETEIHEVTIEDEDGRPYTGRITGKRLYGPDYHHTEVFLTDDERVLVYDGGNLRYWVSDDPARDLREIQYMTDGEYADVLQAMGVTPVIDL